MNNFSSGILWMVLLGTSAMAGVNGDEPKCAPLGLDSECRMGAVTYRFTAGVMGPKNEPVYLLCDRADTSKVVEYSKKFESSDLKAYISSSGHYVVREGAYYNVYNAVSVEEARPLKTHYGLTEASAADLAVTLNTTQQSQSVHMNRGAVGDRFIVSKVPTVIQTGYQEAKRVEPTQESEEISKCLSAQLAAFQNALDMPIESRGKSLKDFLRAAGNYEIHLHLRDARDLPKDVYKSFQESGVEIKGFQIRVQEVDLESVVMLRPVLDSESGCVFYNKVSVVDAFLPIIARESENFQVKDRLLGISDATSLRSE